MASRPPPEEARDPARGDLDICARRGRRSHLASASSRIAAYVNSGGNNAPLSADDNDRPSDLIGDLQRHGRSGDGRTGLLH